MLERMTAACRAAYAARQEVLEADLFAQGFSRQAIDRHGQAAIAAAIAGVAA